MPRGVKRSELEIVEAEIKKSEAKIEAAQSALKKEKSALNKLRVKRDSLMAHALVQHAKENRLSLDDVKALMEKAGNKAAAIAKSAIQKAEDVLETVEKKLPDEKPTDEQKSTPAKSTSKRAPAKKAPAKRTPAKKKTVAEPKASE